MSFENFTELETEISRIISAADEVKIPLRAFGGAAIRLHCAQHSQLYATLRRPSHHDMDFVTYDKFGARARKLFTDLGYDPHVSMALSAATGTGRRRQIFWDRSGNKAVDVCLGAMKMSHVIDFSDRLELDYPTVPLAELLLQKLQVVDMSEKDLQDMVILLCVHVVGQSDDDEINAEHVAKVLARSWGFHHTATTNLRRTAEYATNHPVLSTTFKESVVARVHQLMEVIDMEPKTAQWKLRAQVGTAVRWYNPVEEVQRQREDSCNLEGPLLTQQPMIMMGDLP
jgi:tellurite resistance protein